MESNAVRIAGQRRFSGQKYFTFTQIKSANNPRPCRKNLRMPTQLTSTEKDALARRLQSSNDAERQQAQADLKALIADDVRHIRQSGKIEQLSSFMIVLICIPFIFCDVFAKVPTINDGVFVSMFGLFGCLCVFARRKRRSSQNIMALNIPQVVGPLIEAYAGGGLARSPEFKAVLITLLPQLQATDANMLTLRQRKLLYGFLKNDGTVLGQAHWWSGALEVAVLRALEQIGDEKAVPVVEKLARSARNPKVQIAAQECLPFLQQRAEQVRVEQTLLRASTSTSSLDTLLRPSIAATPTEPQQLLRASHTDNNADSA